MRDLTKSSNKLKQENILKAALELFTTKGFENCTMEMIAAQAGLTRRTIYSYFINKEDVFLFLHIEGLKKRVAHLDEHYDEKLSGIDMLHDFGIKYLDFYLANPGYLRMQIYLEYIAYEVFDKSNIDSKKYLAENKKLSAKVKDIFKKGVDDGSINKDLNLEYYFQYFAITLRSLANHVVYGGRARDYYLTFLDSFIKILKT